MIVANASAAAQFNAEKMGKTTLARGAQMMVGLNCFEPGQQHALHAHGGQDKLYVVLEGEGVVRVGDEEQRLGVGGVAFAADGVGHSMRNPGPGRLVVMAVLAPPPK